MRFPSNQFSFQKKRVLHHFYQNGKILPKDITNGFTKQLKIFPWNLKLPVTFGLFPFTCISFIQLAQSQFNETFHLIDNVYIYLSLLAEN